MNADTDRKYVRRPLAMEELARLMEAAKGAEPIQCVSGPDRAMLYLIAAFTGFRRNEIGSVTSRSFDFESEPPTLTVAAGYSKHRKTDAIPLRKDVADRLKAWIADQDRVRPDQPLFEVTGKRTGAMIRRDLAKARADWLK